METFKQAAIKILQSAGEPLDYREITRRAIEQKLISPVGSTPWATMNATLSTDIIKNGENSQFYRGIPGYYGLRHQAIPVKPEVSTEKPQKPHAVSHPVTDGLNTKQKGDIAEARVAELITLYGTVDGFTCYKPTSDQEGIDLIVKQRGQLNVSYIQIKSTFGYLGRNDPGKTRGFVSTVREKAIVDDPNFLLVFVYFDLSDGDIYDHVFCIPAPDFLRLTQNEKNNTGVRVFTVGLSHPDRSKFAEFYIEKRELANKISELMKNKQVGSPA